MTAEQLARLHARAFTPSGNNSRSWSAAEFSALLDSRFCFAVGDSRAFALGRVVADEAELLTLASDPAHHRQGHARACLQLFEASAAKRGATIAFLEVAADNQPAIALYLNSGYQISATRPAYYNRDQATAVDALIMTRKIEAN